MNAIQKNGTITIRPRKISRENILVYATISNNCDGDIMRYPTGQSHDTKVFIISPTGIIRIIGVLGSRLGASHDLSWMERYRRILLENASPMQSVSVIISSDNKKQKNSHHNKFRLNRLCSDFEPFRSMKIVSKTGKNLSNVSKKVYSEENGFQEFKRYLQQKLEFLC